MQVRQGDVLLIKVGSMPESSKLVPAKNGRLILAEGEATGHSHSILAAYGALFLNGNLDMFLKAEPGCELRHQEHGPIPIDPGIYRVIRQREYSPEEIRNVAD